MLTVQGHQFRAGFVFDFEFAARPGERPRVRCLVVQELHDDGIRRTLRFDADQLRALPGPPFPLSRECVAIAFAADAEWACFMELGWPLPEAVIDVHAMYRCHVNGRGDTSHGSLLNALQWFGLPALAASTKDEMRELAIRGPRSPHEWNQLLRYCEDDVDSTQRLFRRLIEEPTLSLPYELFCGRYTKAVARMEHAGVPLDVERFVRLITQWESIRARLGDEMNALYGIRAFEGCSFRRAHWREWVQSNSIPWPTTDTGHLDLRRTTFRSVAEAYPRVQPMNEARATLARVRLTDLAVGADCRNRCALMPFRSKTGRNQPSSTKFIFGPARWMRGLIKPGPGRAVAYVDWEQQEPGIAAALSGDRAMQEAYRSGDAYLKFAEQAGAVPACATKASHPRERTLFKGTSLAVQYGQGAEGLAARIGQPLALARQLLMYHHRVYPQFWAWSEACVLEAMCRGTISSVGGWRMHVNATENPRTLRNFPMQSTAADILRLSICDMIEAGIPVVAPIHDAVLIEGPAGDIEELVARAQCIMAEASGVFLDGFRLRTEASIVRYPHRYMDERGQEMWDRMMRLLTEIEARAMPESGGARA